MGKANELKARLIALSEREGVVTDWNAKTGAAVVSSGTKSFEVSPELVKEFGDERMFMRDKEVTFEVGDVDGKQMITSLKLKG